MKTLKTAILLMAVFLCAISSSHYVAAEEPIQCQTTTFYDGSSLSDWYNVYNQQSATYTMMVQCGYDDWSNGYPPQYIPYAGQNSVPAFGVIYIWKPGQEYDCVPIPINTTITDMNGIGVIDMPLIDEKLIIRRL